MENPSEQDPSSTPDIQPTYVRPPGLEMTMGVALFGLILMVFFFIQAGVFFSGVIASDPQFQGRSVMELMQDETFNARMQELIFNGDLVAKEAIWSAGVGLILIILATRAWKRKNFKIFLGLDAPSIKRLLTWLGIFILLGLATELIFMERILASSTDRLLLFLGIGLAAPLFEECLLRGLLLGSIRHMADEHTAIAITAGVFTLMHMQYSWQIMLLILPMGIVLGYARTRSGSIWVPVLLHVLNNTVSVFVPAP
jgi:uncharacterized protein